MDSLANQVQRVQQKLIAMQRCFPTLISLDPPVSLQWVVSFESAYGMTLSTDYVQIITQTADGGLMPSFLSQRYWRSLHILNSSHKTMHLPFPLDGSFTQTDGAFDAQSLPGQWLLMGGPDLGWSLITTGPFQGEVWTLGAFCLYVFPVAGAGSGWNAGRLYAVLPYRYGRACFPLPTVFRSSAARSCLDGKSVAEMRPLAGPPP